MGIQDRRIRSSPLSRTPPGRVTQFAGLFHWLERFAVYKNQSTPAEIRSHIDALGIQPGPISRNAGQGERVIGVGEHRPGELVAPSPHLAATAPAAAARRSAPGGPPAVEGIGALHEYLGSGRGLVADHLIGARAASRRVDAFAIGAGSDDHSFAGLQDLRGLVNGAERLLARARPIVIGLRGVVVHVVSLRERQRLLPGNILRTVRQARVGA